jgi:tripartite-type tricarboxylate transporter receptor subunit TctC
MKGKKIIALVLAMTMGLVLVLAGCGGNGSTAATPAPTAAPAATAAGTATPEPTPAPSVAPDFPKHQIDIIVGAGAGGGSDTFARALGQELSDLFGVPVNVLNMPGGNEAIALQELVSRDADGYTLMVTTTTHITETALGNREDPDATQVLTLFHEDTYALHVKEGGKYASIDDFIADAKARPGEVTIGGTYPLSLDELVVRKLEKAAGIQVNYVPYSETGKMQADVLGGHIDAMLDEFPPSIELIEAKELRPLVVFAEKRLDNFPDLPTTVELGWDVTDGMLRGVIIKSGTPDDILDLLENAMSEAYHTERYQEFADGRMLNLKDAFAGADEYNAIIKERVEEYKEIYEQLDMSSK